jgi:hypothetical protein
MSIEYFTLQQHTFFSAAHGTFSKVDHTLQHKANLSKCKKIVYYDHNVIKLELKQQQKILQTTDS